MIFNNYEPFGVDPAAFALGKEAEASLTEVYQSIAAVRETNQLRVLAALQETRLSDSHFHMGSGYGYDDSGRDRIEQAYAAILGAEAALVRVQISSGTQAIAACLYGVLRPGDVLLSVTGQPYDTLSTVIGLKGSSNGSLDEFGVKYRQVDLTADGRPDLAAIESAWSADVRMVFIQKSRGYSDRRSLRTSDIAKIVATVRRLDHAAVVMVDNCYGEFVETVEPCAVGADLCAGSLIKNPGGGICPTGGYIAGRAQLVELAASHITAPGQGAHIGPTLGLNRAVAQGLYLAPHVVAEALKGAVFAAQMFALAGYATAPTADEARGDIVQTLTFGAEEPLLRFCRAIQAAAPVPWEMPGYDCPVIMAAGAFVQGASIELSADGPVKPPYTAYMQGGLVYENVKLACLMALSHEGKSV